MKSMIKYGLLAFLCLLPSAAQVVITPGPEKIDVTIDGKPFTALYIGKTRPKPFLYPLLSPSGKNLTRGWPMDPHDGEPHDHPHHQGLWYSHGEVNGVDYWANGIASGSAKKGRITLEKLVSAQGGQKQGTIDALFHWIDDTGRAVLMQELRVTFHAQPSDERILDYVTTLTPLVDVEFQDTKEGTFAIRLTPRLEEDKGGKMVMASGATGEKNVWGKASPWVDYFGGVDGETLGIAILDHPSNEKFPTYWHSRAYGLFAANRYGEHDFFADKSRNGGVKYAKGEPVTFRYRIIIHEGDTAAAKIADQYAAFSRIE